MTPLLPSTVGSVYGGAASEGRPLLGHVSWSGFLSSHLASFLPLKSTSRCLRFPLEPDTCSSRRPTPQATICVSQSPNVSTPVRPCSSRMGRVAKIRAEYPSSKAWLCGQVLRSTALMDRRSPPDLVHFLGFHTCIFLGRSELEIRGLLWQQLQPCVPDRPCSFSLQKRGRPPCPGGTGPMQR